MSVCQSCEPVGIVLQRVAAEVASTADDLGHVEAHVAAMIEGAQPAGGFEQLQALDRLSQQLRAIGTFLSAATSCGCGRLSLKTALDRVSLEGIRERLAGGSVAVTNAPSEPEFW